ncbi:hypothetical protein [Robbsia sp. KACC 23696]|uniref:hypothetical protein n=1 Tax=Robbsia sp. KACC 23696 TaxID=3149231 RepID=UPI00325BEB8A
MRSLRTIFMAGTVLFTPILAQAQEVSADLGALRGSAGGESTYTWSFGYRQSIYKNLSLGATWLNEGHVPDHHRDGSAFQIWYDQALFSPRFTVGLGAGPYRYYDTSTSPNRLYVNQHGWGVLYSVTANWAATEHLRLQLRFNEVQAPGSIQSSSLLFGLSYSLPKSALIPDPSDTRLRFPHGDELTVMAGKTVVNSLSSQSTFSKSVEYRHTFSQHIEGTVAWIDEGNTRLTERNGVATQIWLTEPLYHDKLTIGMGVGPYLAADTYRVSRDSDRTGAKLSGLFTMSASYRVTPHVVVRFSWDRVLTTYNRDTDIFLIGAGYRF